MPGAHRRDVADTHDAAILRPHHDRGEIVERADRADRTHDQRFVADLEPARAVVAIARLDRRAQILDAQPRRRQRAIVGAHLEGFGKAAERVDISNAGNGAQGG